MNGGANNCAARMAAHKPSKAGSRHEAKTRRMSSDPWSEFLDSPILDLGYVDCAGAVYGDVVCVVELAWDLAVAAQDAEHLSVQVELDDAIVLAVAHVDRVLSRHVLQTPGRADVGPLAEELAARIENLDALVG